MNKNITKTTYKVSDLLSWQRSGSLELSPSFQRRSVWPEGAKSLLIDTVVKEIPMPIIFLRERISFSSLEASREVVDGQQRLRTLFAFIDPSSLRDFEADKDGFTVKKTHNPSIAGRTFSQLDTDSKKALLNYDFSVHVLPSDTEDSEVLRIFARMNSTGVKLNAQELRNAEFFGAFKNLSYTLGYEQLSRWRNWGVFSENLIARMSEVEVTSDFIRLMLEGLQGFSQAPLNRLYKKYESDFPFEAEVTRRFHIIMDRIDEGFGSDIGKSEFSRPALFHTLFTFIYELTFGDSENAALTGHNRASAKPLPSNLRPTLLRASELISTGTLTEELAKALRGATADKGSRQVRLRFLYRVLKGVE